MSAVEADPHGGDALGAMVANLTAPLSAGAAVTRIPLDDQGDIEVAWSARHPMLVVALRRSLDDVRLEVDVRLPDGGERELVFGVFTERGASLAVLVPAEDGVGRVAPFAVRVTRGALVARDGTRRALAAAELADWLEGAVVEGILGRLLHVMGSESPRLRARSRELAAARRLETAHAAALDRLGGALGVPRFLDDLRYLPPPQPDLPGRIVTQPRPEPDDEYRRRLALFRPWVLPSASGIRSLLDVIGLDPPLELVERDDDLAVAVRLVGTAEARAALLGLVRRAHLVWPGAGAAADAVHDGRMRTAGGAAREGAIRGRIRAGFDLPAPDAALAPMLAASLARVAACREALGEAGRWRILRAQDPLGGSRYELGLGCDLGLPTAAELDRLAQAHAVRARPAGPPADELAATLDGLVPRPSGEDPEGRWLLEPCGLRTVHRLDDERAYVSHLPTHGLLVDGPVDLPQPAGWALFARTTDTRDGTTLLTRYAPRDGVGEVVRVDAAGSFSSVRRHEGWRTTWTAIAACEPPGRAEDVLAFYERDSGTLELYVVNGDGSITRFGGADVGPGWTTMLCAELRVTRCDLILYSRASGDLAIHAIEADGALTLRAEGGVGRGWTHILALQPYPRAPAVLLLYDAVGGRAELREVDAAGRTSIRWRTSWLGRFTDLAHIRDDLVGTTTALIGYDRATGRLSRMRIDGPGLREVGAEDRAGRWTHVVGGPLRGGPPESVLDADPPPPANLLLYSRTDGRHALRRVGDDGAGGVVAAGGGWDRADPVGLDARLHAPGDPGRNAALARAIESAARVWESTGRPAWEPIDDADASVRWAEVVAVGAGDPAHAALVAAGLPVVADPARVRDRLAATAPDLIETIALPDAVSAGLRTGDGDAVDDLRELVRIMRASGVASLLPLVTADAVLMVLGAIGLPEAGLNLTGRQATGFRWYAIPVEGEGGVLGTVGARTRFTPAGPGVTAIVVLAHDRGDGTDPYEFRVQAAEGQAIGLKEYEMVMNALGRAHPAGVEVNTYRLRREHVDLDGDGTAEPLTPRASRTYRAFRHPRARGGPDAR